MTKIQNLKLKKSYRYCLFYNLEVIYILNKTQFFLTICWQPSIVIKSIINYRYVVKTIENYMEIK